MRFLGFAAAVLVVLASSAGASVTWSTVTGPVSDSATNRNHIGTDGTALYVVFYNNQFYKYTFTQGSPTAGTWTRLADPPRNVCCGDSYSDLAYQNGYLYTCAVPQSGLTRTVIRYRISNNTWQVWQSSGGVDLEICNTTGNGLFMDPAHDGVGISAWHAGYWWVEFDWNAKTADNNWISPSNLAVLDPHWVSRNEDVAASGTGTYYAVKNDFTAGLSSGDVVYKWTGTAKGTQPSLVTTKPWLAGFGQSIEFIPGTIAPSGHDELWLLRGSNSADSCYEGWGQATSDWARLDLTNVAAGWTTGSLPGTVGYTGEVTLVNGSVFARGVGYSWYVTMPTAPPHNPIPISTAKGHNNGDPAEVEGVVSAVFSSDHQFYVQSTTRECGIQVRYPGGAPALQQIVDVQGTVEMDSTTHERYVNASSWSQTGDPCTVRPLGVNSRFLGGGALGKQEAVTNGLGLNNVGLLVRIWGKVTGFDTDFSHVYVDDRSGVNDGTGPKGVRVDMGAIYRPQRPKPAVGEMVFVTGVSSMASYGGGHHRTVRVASSSDLAIYGDNGNRPKTFTVLVINLDPIIEAEGGYRLHQILGWSDPHTLANGCISDLEQCSGGWAKYRIAEWIDADLWPVKRDGYQETDASYLYSWRHGGPWHQPDGADYYRLISDYHLDTRVASGEIDEVWFFGAPWMGFYESQMAGPGAYWCNSGGLPDVNSGRIFVMMCFSYERQVGEMLENYGHRAESIMWHVYGSWHNTYPPQHNWDAFTLYDKTAPGHAACGNVHYAPNSQSDYDWGNTTYVWSTCDDWLYNWPNLQGQSTQGSVNHAEWGYGDIRLHHKWWFTHFPKAAGVNPDGKQNNWWKYLADFNSYAESR